MDESANTGVESKGSDAEIRESCISRIVVEGYDTSLPRFDVEEALREHLASCGNIIHVYVPINDDNRIICRISLIYVNQEDEEKVLRLDGSDMGGRTLHINPYPFNKNDLEKVLAPMKEGQFSRPQHTVMVTGCDSSLPIDVIETQLEKYFSALGSFVYHEVTASGAIITPASVYVRGQEGVEKALQRSGRSVGGLNFVVTRVVPLPKKTRPTGYIHPINFTLLTKEQIENPNIYFVYDTTEEDCGGNQKKKKKSKTTERNQKKKMKKKEKKKSKTREENQKKKGVEISF